MKLHRIPVDLTPEEWAGVNEFLMTETSEEVHALIVQDYVERRRLAAKTQPDNIMPLSKAR